MPLGTKFLPCPSIGTPGKRKYKTWQAFYPKILGLKNILNPTRQPGPGADTNPPPLTSVGGRRRATSAIRTRQVKGESSILV